MRYIIHGAGAIGCFIGGLLAESGSEVVVIARPEQADIINQQGITIHSYQDTIKKISNIHAVTHPRFLTPRPDDILMLAVKSPQTNQCVHELHEVFPQETPFFCLQNGIRNEASAAERFLHVYGVMITACVNYVSPGLVAHTLNHDLVLGNYPLGCDEIVSQVAQDLTRAGFNAILSSHVMAAKWGKLILNLSNALLAVTGHYLQLAYADPEVSLLMAELQEEGLSVLQAANIPLEEGKSPLDVWQMTKQARMVGEQNLQEPAFKEAQQLPENKRTYVSTWIDLQRRRGETEAGYLNGEVILLGEKHHIPTPLNAKLFEVIETLAAQKLSPGQYSAKELRSFMKEKPSSDDTPSQNL